MLLSVSVKTLMPTSDLCLYVFSRLKGNLFTGLVPDLSSLAFLRILDLADNALEGDFPFSKHSFWSTPAGNSLQEMCVFTYSSEKIK